MISRPEAEPCFFLLAQKKKGKAGSLSERRGLAGETRGGKSSKGSERAVSLSVGESETGGAEGWVSVDFTRAADSAEGQRG